MGGQTACGRASRRTRDDLATVGSNNWVVSGRAVGVGAAPAGQRPAPQPPAAVAALHRAPERAGLERHRRRRAGPARRRRRPQRAHRVRVHHRRHRPAGPLRRAARPGEPDARRYVPAGSSRCASSRRPSTCGARRLAPSICASLDTGPCCTSTRSRQRAYALRWVGTEPGTAGYLASLSLERARNWDEFRAAAARWAVPSENLVYADVDGNIGWVVGGLTPVRRGWNGLLPVPGHEGRFEWDGLPARLRSCRSRSTRPMARSRRRTTTSCRRGTTNALGYDWSPPHRYQRIVEALAPRPRSGTSPASRRCSTTSCRWRPRERSSTRCGGESRPCRWRAPIGRSPSRC